MSYGRFMGAENLEMVEGFGALGVVPPRYIAANDNRADGWKPTTMVPAGYVEDAAGKQWPAVSFVPYYHNVPVAQQPARAGDWMQTYTGGVFFPMDPRESEVHIEDIAHALSMQCRFAGHCIRFYSVAEHSVHIAWWLYRHAGAMTALQGLLHDASEAYLVDVPRPVKPHLSGYKDAEARVQAVIMKRFNLPIEMPRAVKEADDRIIGDELVNLKPMDWHAEWRQPLGVTLAYWSPAEAEERFLAAFRALMDEVRGGDV